MIPRAAVVESKAGSEILGAAGLVLCLVSWSHTAVILIPPHFGISPWEFAAATQVIDVAPLGLMGMALLATAAITRSWRKRSVALAIWSGFSALVIAGVATLIVLDMLVAWHSVTINLRENLTKTAGKALFFAFMFTAFYIWLAVQLIRARRNFATARR